LAINTSHLHFFKNSPTNCQNNSPTNCHSSESPDLYTSVASKNPHLTSPPRRLIVSLPGVSSHSGSNTAPAERLAPKSGAHGSHSTGPAEKRLQSYIRRSAPAVHPSLNSVQPHEAWMSPARGHRCLSICIQKFEQSLVPQIGGALDKIYQTHNADLSRLSGTKTCYGFSPYISGPDNLDLRCARAFSLRTPAVGLVS